MIARNITYFGHPMIVICDANCRKAWGRQVRPRHHLSDEWGDFEYLTDNELDEAPNDPWTREGGESKPQDKDARLNKWCIRECERSLLVIAGRDFELSDFDQRIHWREYLARLHSLAVP